MKTLPLALLICTAPFVRGQALPTGTVHTCGEATLARPGQGVAYRGLVQNSDYRFTATIPDGLVGWGAAPDAAFHGFAIYLDSRRSSCIIFEIHLRVELPEDKGGTHGRREKGRRTTVGNRRGWQTVESGLAGGSALTNANVFVELARNGYINDASITLITPNEDAPRNREVLNRFLASFHFD